jgi:hypothetical protein
MHDAPKCDRMVHVRARESRTIPSEIAVGPCPHCQQELAQPERTLPRRLSLSVRRLDDAERRWDAARESSRIGHGDGHLRPHSPGGLRVADAALATRTGL